MTRKYAYTLVLSLLLAYCSSHNEKVVKPESYEVQLEKLQKIDLELKSTGTTELLRTAILAEIMAHSHEINACYQNILKRHPNIEGTVVTNTMIQQNGRLAKFSIPETTLKSSSMESCISKTFRDMDFPASNYAVDATYSLVFRLEK